jgi:hypothetical protein
MSEIKTSRTSLFFIGIRLKNEINRACQDDNSDFVYFLQEIN